MRPDLLPRRARLCHALGPELPWLASIKTRRRLEREHRYHRLAPEIARVIEGLEWDLDAGPAKAAPSSPGTVRVVAWNVERGKRFEPLLGLLREHPLLASADILMLNEVDIGMGRSGNRNVPGDLARALGMRYVFANSHLVLAPGDRTERDHREPNGLSLHGNALLTRLPILRFEAVTLPEYRDRFHAVEKRLGDKRALLAEVLLPDGPLLCAVVHLDPFSPPRHRAFQIEVITRRIAELAPARVLLGGDLNTNTYDLGGAVGFAANAIDKFRRFGFDGTLAQYMVPEAVYERPVFDALERACLRTQGYNDRSRGTIYYDVNDEDLIAKAGDYAPQVLLRWLRRRLEPRGGVVPLKVDWFAGRGIRARGAHVIERPRWSGAHIADHNPIIVDLETG